MSLRLAIAASLFDMADETGRQSKRKHNFADNGLKAKKYADKQKDVSFFGN